MSGRVFVVHCIDTEGPLEESLTATFERLYQRGLPPDVAPSRASLTAIQTGSHGRALADFVAPRRLDYLTTWEAVTTMLERVTSAERRAKYPDSLGRPYRFSWFVLDLVGARENPRRRAQGPHAVWDNVSRFFGPDDAVGFHFHTVPVTGEALEYNTCWTNTTHHEVALCRRLLERRHFPSLFRAGATIERNDLSYYLEQFIPFDYSSRGGVNTEPGDQVDWRGAASRWGAYHPDWRDYRRPGGMRRWIARCLDADSWITALGEADVVQAFEQARSGETTILSYASHDRRDIELDVARVYDLIIAVAARFPGVEWQHQDALTAMQKLSGQDHLAAPQVTLTRQGDVVTIRSDQLSFGPVPFLAVAEEGGIVYRDNPVPGQAAGCAIEWVYRLPHPRRTRAVGAALANEAGWVGLDVIGVP